MSTDTECAPKKESQVTTELNAMEKVQTSLSDRIGQLEDRLASAMQDPDPKEKNAEEADLVPLARRLRDCRHIVEEQLSIIEYILDRLEL